MKYLTTLIILLSFQQLMSQHTESIAIRSFEDLKVTGPFEVELFRGNEVSLTLDPGDIPLDEIIAEVSGGQLTLKMQTSAFFNDRYYDDYRIKVTLYYTELHSITAHAGSIIRSETLLEMASLSLEATTGAHINLKTNTERLWGKTVTGGEILLYGQTIQLDAIAKTGGIFSAKKLQTDEAYLKAVTGGVVRVSVADKVEAEAELGGEVYYYGDPEVWHTNTSLGGVIQGRSYQN